MPARTRLRWRVAPPARVVVAHALAAVAMSMPWPLLIDEVWRRTHDDTLLGVTGAARLLPYVALSWLVARLADRFARSRVIRGTLLLRIALLGAGALVSSPVGTGWLGASSAQTASVILATAVVAAATPAYPAAAAGMPALSGDENDRWTQALVTVEVGSFVVGPALGGALVGRLSVAAVFGVAALSTVAALGLLRTVRMPRPGRSGAAAGDPGATGAARAPSAPGAAPKRRALSAQAWCAIAVMVVLNAAMSGLGLLLVPLAETEWGDLNAYGPAVAALGIGAAATPVIASALRLHTSGRSILWFVGATLMVGGSPGLAVATLPLVVAGGASVRAEALATEALQSAVPDERRAAALGSGDTAMVAAALVASAVAPHVTTMVGARPHGVVVGLGVAASAALLARRVRYAARSEATNRRNGIPGAPRGGGRQAAYL
jgi:MFS family permease